MCMDITTYFGVAPRVTMWRQPSWDSSTSQAFKRLRCDSACQWNLQLDCGLEHADQTISRPNSAVLEYNS